MALQTSLALHPFTTKRHLSKPSTLLLRAKGRYARCVIARLYVCEALPTACAVVALKCRPQNRDAAALLRGTGLVPVCLPLYVHRLIMHYSRDLQLENQILNRSATSATCESPTRQNLCVCRAASSSRIQMPPLHDRCVHIAQLLTEVLLFPFHISLLAILQSAFLPHTTTAPRRPSRFQSASLPFPTFSTRQCLLIAFLRPTNAVVSIKRIADCGSSVRANTVMPAHQH